jgi:hypothetical protein
MMSATNSADLQQRVKTCLWLRELSRDLRQGFRCRVHHLRNVSTLHASISHVAVSGKVERARFGLPDGCQYRQVPLDLSPLLSKHCAQ